MTNRKKPSPAGLGRASMALGSKDPRLSHRNPQASQATEQLYGPGLTMANDGKLSVTKIRRVNTLPPDGTDLGTLVAAFNNLVEEMKKAGHL